MPQGRRRRILYSTMDMKRVQQKLQPVLFLIFLLCILLFTAPIVPIASMERSAEEAPPELAILRSAYPDVLFSSYYDEEVGDWRITVQSDGRVSELYYAGGRFLKEEHLSDREKYRVLIYPFRERVTDPETMTPEEIEWFSRFGATENRRTAPVSADDFFDAIYDIGSREAIERNLERVTFLGYAFRIHRLIAEPLARVEKKVRGLSAEDPAIAEYISQLGSGDGYQWRQIRDTGGRSFHSMGLAIDLLPKNYHSKTIYWLWEKNAGNDRWMLIPLDQRWMPPGPVVDAFESEGFIWGGKWPVWDNMHFEYRPELLHARDEQ